MEVDSLSQLTNGHQRVAIEHVLSRGLSDPQVVTSPAPTLAVGSAPGCTNTWPTCNVIFNANETLTQDALLLSPAREYYQLTPATPKTVDNAAWPASAVHYDPFSFPSWRGTSVTFSAWVKPSYNYYLLAKHPDWAVRPPSPTQLWSLSVNSFSPPLPSLIRALQSILGRPSHGAGL